MRQFMAALAALLVALPVRATVTGTTTSTSYTCTGAVSIYTIPFPYLAASQVVATQTTATGATSIVIGTVKPSIAPTIGTITLSAACPSGSTLTLSRVMSLTQLQSFRTGSYSGVMHEQAFDRLEMQLQQVDANAQRVATSGQNGQLSSADWTRFNNSVLSSTNQYQSAGTGSVVRTIASKLSDVLSVRDFGATGNGTTDDTVAIQAAINAALAVSGKPLSIYVPSGVYKVSASLLFYDQSGISFRGAGAATTQFAPTTALASLPVLLIRNIRNSTFSGFTINAVPSGTGAVGIQIDRAALGPNGFTSTANKFDEITVGGASVGITDGVQITSAVDADNDKHEFTRSFRVLNFTGNAFYLGHINALWERIEANIDRGPVGIFIFAGAADIKAIFGPLLTGTEVKIGGGGGFGRHPTTISGNSEQNGTNTVKLLTVSDANVEVRYDHYERQGGPTSATNLIDWTGGTGFLQIVGSRFLFGQPGSALNITGTGTAATLVGSRLGFDVINYVGRMMYSGNTWTSGTVTETEVGGGTGTFCHVHDYGSTFSTTPIQCSTGTRWSLGGAATGYLSSTGTVMTLTGEDLILATAGKGVQADTYASRTSGNSAIVEGRIATAQSKVGVQLGNSGLLNTATDLLVGIYAGVPGTDPKVVGWGPDGRVTYSGNTFANLSTAGSTANGTILYCSDCTVANPCAGSGTGAFAKRLNGVWVCN